MKWVLIGAGGTTKVIIAGLLKQNILLQNILILDDDVSLIGKNILNVNIVDTIQNINRYIERNDVVINCVGSAGNNSSRNSVYKKLYSLGVDVDGYVDPGCNVSYSDIHKTTMLLPGTIVNPGSVVGYNTLLNTNVTIEHDCKIGNYTFISPCCNIAGNVTIGNNVFVGIGTTIIGNIVIGDDVIIGAGSLVLRNVPSNSKVYGVPTHR